LKVGLANLTTGLRLEFSAVTFVPEPGMGGVMLIGTLGVLAGRMRSSRVTKD
jgi:hypothetical protein